MTLLARLAAALYAALALLLLAALAVGVMWLAAGMPGADG